MPIVVQKYGGSSLADAESIKRVARRIAETKKAGNDVVVASPRWATPPTSCSTSPTRSARCRRAREMDMLMTAGERISMALVAMAITDLGHSARSFTGSQAGVITDGVHGKAKIIDVTPGASPRRSAKDHIVIVAGFQGVSQDDQGDHHPRPRGHRHHRRRARRGPGRRGLRDLHRRRRRLHRRPAHRAVAPARSTASPTRRCSSSRPPAARCCTCAASSTPAASTSPSTSARRSPRRRARSSRTSQDPKETPWKPRSSPVWPTTAARPRSPSSACPTARAWPPQIFQAVDPRRRSTST